MYPKFVLEIGVFKRKRQSGACEEVDERTHWTKSSVAPPVLVWMFARIIFAPATNQSPDSLAHGLDVTAWIRSRHWKLSAKRKGRSALSVKVNDFTVWRHTWRKNWINCAVLTGNSAGLRTALSNRLSHTELRSSLRESHTHSVQFFVQFFYTVKLHSFNLECMGPLTGTQFKNS
jgi:hypothetical protein